MKKMTVLFLLFLLFLQGVAGLSSQTEVLALLRLANDYFINKYPDPGAPIVHPDRTRPSNIWTRATYFEGLMALYSIDKARAGEYYDYAVNWGESHSWSLWGGAGTINADNQCCGQTYIDLYNIDPQPERIRDITTSINNMINSSTNSGWSWIDAIQMAMPVFAKLGALYDDSRYFEKMHSIYNFSKNSHGTKGLYNPEDGLWWRDKDFDPPYMEPNGENCYWSRGNGWVFTALVRVLDVIPGDALHRDEYLQTYREMAKALIAVQRDDGFWNVSLHDPGHFGGPETSGTAFFVYGLAWGINKNLLDRNEYFLPVEKGWNALASEALHSDGFLGYVQGTGKQPSDGQPVAYNTEPNFDDYGLGAFLLAGSEVYKLASEVLKGDANSDGVVNILDALQVAQYSVGMDVSINSGAVDMDCNDIVNIIDALIIAQKSVGLVINVSGC